MSKQVTAAILASIQTPGELEAELLPRSNKSQMQQPDLDYVFDSMPQASMILDTDLKYVRVNDALCAAVQKSREDMIGRYVFDVFPEAPERVELARKVFERTLLHGETIQLRSQVYQISGPDGKVVDRLWDTEQRPIRGADNQIKFMIQYSEDVTEREALRTERDLVTDELKHRLGNTLAIMQSVAEHTAEASHSVEGFLHSFRARLNSLNRNFLALSDANWSGLELEQIIRTELEPLLNPSADQVTLMGPGLQMSVKATKDLSMVFHELATNSTKHGFLTSSAGKLAIVWNVEGDQLNLDWTESGLSGVRPPAQSGFGLQLFEMIPDLNLSLDFQDSGLRAHFKFRLRDEDSAR